MNGIARTSLPIRLLAIAALLLPRAATAQLGPESVSHWRVTLKDGTTIASDDLPRKQVGDVTTWTGDVRVTVTASKDGNFVRSRIKVQAIKPGIGLKNVVYPIVKDIKPLSDDDRLLQAFRTGYTQPTPLATGKPVSQRYCISYYMQFTALLGGGRGSRGLYIGEHDPTAAWKDMTWSPNTEAQTLTYEIAHPVLDWGGDEPVRLYESPGDCVIGMFDGDWFDAARIYRKWAVTAPWCAKGPMHGRADYPKWVLDLDYWTIGHVGDYPGQQREFIKRGLLDFKNTITHDYGYYGQPYQHDVNIDYLPPRCGSVIYQDVLKKLRALGGRVVPYVIGWMWNSGTESYQLENGEKLGAMLGDDRKSVIWAELSPSEPNIAMCPASKIWRDKLSSVAVELVKFYRTGGVYFDYFTSHMNDCHNPDHGHPLGGGNYWTSGVRGAYQQVRDAIQNVDPEAMICAEDISESSIGVVDVEYTSAWAYIPMWQAVYHDYVQLFGGMHWMEENPLKVGRQWLLGHMNQLGGGWGYFEGDTIPPEKMWHVDLLRCHRDFARPYLGYGEMLRPPEATGDLPTLTAQGNDGPFTTPAVEGTAWRAHDGSVGIFFFNYHSEAQQFSWTKNVEEIAGFSASTQLQITQWTVDGGAKPVRQTPGGVIRADDVKIAPRSFIALKLEPVK